MMRAVLIFVCALICGASKALAETSPTVEALVVNPCAFSTVNEIPGENTFGLKLHIDISGLNCENSDIIIMMVGQHTVDGPEIIYAFRDNAVSLVSGETWELPVRKRVSSLLKTAVHFAPSSDIGLDTYLSGEDDWFTSDVTAIKRAITENALTFTHSTGCNSNVTYALLDGKAVKLVSTTAP